MQIEPALAFATRALDPPALEIRVNFGVFAGREATAAEIDLLAQALLPEIGSISIVSEQRHEVSDHAEALVHQVRIEVPSDELPGAEHELDRMTHRLVRAAEEWAESCIEERHISEVEL